MFRKTEVILLPVECTVGICMQVTLPIPYRVIAGLVILLHSVYTSKQAFVILLLLCFKPHNLNCQILHLFVPKMLYSFMYYIFADFSH